MNPNGNAESLPPEVDTSFLRALQLYNKGEKLNEASAALRKVNEAVNAVGKGGSVTIKLDIKPSGNAVMFGVDVSYSLPKLKASPAIFFLDENFNLTRKDPDQEELNLRVADGGQQATAEPLRKAVEA